MTVLTNQTQENINSIIKLFASIIIYLILIPFTIIHIIFKCIFSKDKTSNWSTNQNNSSTGDEKFLQDLIENEDTLYAEIDELIEKNNGKAIQKQSREKYEKDKLYAEIENIMESAKNGKDVRKALDIINNYAISQGIITKEQINITREIAEKQIEIKKIEEEITQKKKELQQTETKENEEIIRVHHNIKEMPTSTNNQQKKYNKEDLRMLKKLVEETDEKYFAPEQENNFEEK